MNNQRKKMSMHKAINDALKYYQSGHFREAEEKLREILTMQPDNVEALLSLGEISYQSGNYQAAEEYVRKALDWKSDSAEIHNNLGLILQERGKLEEAIQHFCKATELEPEIADLYYNLGNAFKEKKQFDDAIVSYQRALQYNPDLVEAYNNIGLAFHEKGSFKEAIVYYQKALQVKVDYADAYFNLGNAFQRDKQYDQAITSYFRALDINPALPGAYNNLGLILQEREDLKGALLNFRKAVQMNPNFAMAHYNLGTVLYLQKELDEAIAHYRKALKLDPYIDNAYLHLGIVLQEKGFLEDALLNYQHFLSRNPNSVGAHTNLGIVLAEQQRLNEAISILRKALDLDPNNAEVHWNLSLSLLLAGNFEDGWREYEWRLRIKEFEQRKFSRPLWDGSDIRGRTILLYAEQGTGDAIHFIRYAPLIAQRGARVIVECQKELISLLQSVEGVKEIVERGKALPEFDIHSPLLSLPLIFHTTLDTIPAEIPYIRVDPALKEKWRERIQHELIGFKVGLVWAGNPIYRKDRMRSCSLEQFLPLGKVQGTTFYSLQKGETGKKAKSFLRDMNVLDYMEEIQDFMDTAALIENLDLVISVDTAVAHLAGALGKPVWTLIPFSPDWRWMLHREDTPWYPTMRLFRQTAPGDWKTVVERIGKQLRKLII